MVKQRPTGLPVAQHSVGACPARYLNGATRCVLVTIVIGLSVSSPALAQGDGCPDSGSAGNTTPVMTIHTSVTPTCSVTNGSYVKSWTSITVDLEATATGYCHVYYPLPSCPWQDTQLRN